MNQLVDTLPDWAIAGLLFVALCLAAEAGSRFRRRYRPRGETLYATSAAVSLLALLIGFTFSVALNRYDNRRDLVVEEAAAVFATWERLQLQDDPERAVMGATMRGYVDQRLRYFTEDTGTNRQRRSDAIADALMDRMWTTARSLSARNVKPLSTRMLMDGLARVDDAAWRREAIAREHIPLLVIDLLVVFAVIAAASMGFSGAQRRVARPAHLLFFVMVSATIMLVIDLDRPREGMVIVSQQPMQEMEEKITADLEAGL